MASKRILMEHKELQKDPPTSSSAGLKRKRDNKAEDDDDDDDDAAAAGDVEKTSGDLQINKNLTPFQRFWTPDNEIVILKRFKRFCKIQKCNPSAVDMAKFYVYVEKHLEMKFTKVQLSDKVRRLRLKWEKKVKKNPDMSSLDEHDLKVFKLSEKIWGGNVKQAEPLSHGCDDIKDYDDISLEYLTHMVQHSTDGMVKFLSKRLKLPHLKAKFKRLMVAYFEFNGFCNELVKDVINTTLYETPSDNNVENNNKFFGEMVQHSKLDTIGFLFQRFKLLNSDLKTKFVRRLVVAYLEYVGILQELLKEVI